MAVLMAFFFSSRKEGLRATGEVAAGLEGGFLVGGEGEAGGQGGAEEFQRGSGVARVPRGHQTREAEGVHGGGALRVDVAGAGSVAQGEGS